MNSENAKKNLILIDGHSLAYRMYFALEHTRMKTKDNKPTWALYGFFTALFSLLQKTKPDAIAVSFDVGSETFRNALYSEYKANRASMPDELRDQMSSIHHGVELLGIPIYELANYEADDVIGTLSKRAAEEGWLVHILTGDQDSFQLVEDDKIEILIPSRSVREGLKTFNRQAVFEKWGVYPEQVIDYKGLRGDTSDNIPGIPGVGEKTAVKLLSEYPDLDKLYANLDKLPKNKLLEKLETHKDMAFLSRQLATIDLNTPIDANFEDCHLLIPDMDALIAFFEANEFRQMIKQAPVLLAPFLGESKMPPVATAKVERSEIELDVATEPEVAAGAVAVLEKRTAVLTVPHRILQTEEALEAWVRQLQSWKVFALDLETTGLDPLTSKIVGIAMSGADGFSQSTRPAENRLKLKTYPTEFTTLDYAGKTLASEDIESVYVPICHECDGDQITIKRAVELLGPVLKDPDIVKIVHNAKFELNMFRELGVDWQGLVFDTMIASYVQTPDSRHGLKHLGFQHFQWTMQEIKALIGSGKSEILFSRVDLEPAASYACCDSYVTLKLAEKFVTTFDADQKTLFYELEMPLAWVLADLERTGVPLDIDYLKALSGILDEQIKKLETDIYDLVGLPFNLNSPKQLNEILFVRLGLSPTRKTKGKTAFSTDAKVLEDLVDAHPVIEKILAYRQLFKLKSTYVDALPELVNPKTHRLHTSFNQTVAATGRLSSSNPNLQNIPIRTELGSQIRRAFVPPQQEGWQLLSADYSQIELRLLAHFSEDENLIEAFNQGEDIHAATAALVFGLPLDRVTKDLRYKAKAVNFGVIYGQTAHGLSQQLKIPRAEAAEFIDRYFFKYPKVKACIERIKAEARVTGKVSTIAGRVRDLSEGLNSKVRGIKEFSERAAFNTPLQGSAADLMKAAMIRLQNDLKRQKLKSQIILQVHDELVLEVPDDELALVTERVRWAMELDQPLLVPLVVDLHTGKSWLES